MRLSIRHLSKTFGPVTVLRDASLDVAAGEIHGLVGQNGSGKSTMIKILSGYHAPDAGASISVDEKELTLPVRPTDLNRCGLSFVHQDFGLIDDLSVTENVRVGRFDARRVSRFITWSHERARVSDALARLGGSAIDTRALVGTLSHVERATVAIARAIESQPPGAGCVVFDESTTSLPRTVLSEFYQMVQDLAATGTSVVVVSHRLDEILSLCDRVTVLEDGRVTAAGFDTATLDEKALTRIVMGTSRPAAEQKALRRASTSAAISATGSRGGVRLTDVRGDSLAGVDLSIGRGEVVGVTGLPGSGFERLPYAVVGALQGTTGTVEIDGDTYDLRGAEPHKTCSMGAVLIPGARVVEGIALDLTALENVSLPRVFGKNRFLLRRDWQLAEFEEIVERFGVVPANPSLLASAFSGGNQQKLMIGKWLLSRPRFIALHEPTQAVDVGARTDILHALRVEADNGAAVLIATIEPEDLSRLCDRVVVMHGGRVVAEITGPEEITPDRIIESVYDCEER